MKKDRSGVVCGVEWRMKGKEKEQRKGGMGEWSGWWWNEVVKSGVLY